jgi:hypothetical protein
MTSLMLTFFYKKPNLGFCKIIINNSKVRFQIKGDGIIRMRYKKSVFYIDLKTFHLTILKMDPKKFCPKKLFFM